MKMHKTNVQQALDSSHVHSTNQGVVPLQLPARTGYYDQSCYGTNKTPLYDVSTVLCDKTLKCIHVVTCCYDPILAGWVYK